MSMMMEKIAFVSPVIDAAHPDDWVPCSNPASMYAVFVYMRGMECYHIFELYEDIDEAFDKANELHSLYAKKWGMLP